MTRTKLRATGAVTVAAVAALTPMVVSASTDTTTADTATAGTTAGTATAETDTEGTAPAEGATSGSGWTVDVEECSDPAAATAPIEGTIKIGMTAPLSGGAAASAFGPVTVGMQAYVDYANENGLIPGHDLQLIISDDQYNPALTPDAVNGLLDQGVHVFSGNIGSPQNFAVMGLLNEECVPQMMVLSGLDEFSDPEANPWTFGGQLVYSDEAAAYAKAISEMFPDGAKVAEFLVNSEFGQTYGDAFGELAGDYNIDIVESQSIEATDTAPPTAQVNAIAAAKPDAILAVPLGAGCPVFLQELANAKAANAGWDPKVFITNTCASQLILAVAGESANGVYTSAYAGLHDVMDPAQAALPGPKAYLDYMTSKGNTDFLATAGAGWNTAEVTVEILKRAAASANGLTRQSIIEAARDLDYHPSLARDGANARMAGNEDGALFQTVQIIQFDQPNGIWLDVGEMIHEFED